MKRALVTVFAAAAFVLAMPSLAVVDHGVDQQVDPNTGNGRAVASGGGEITPAANGTLPADAQSVTGEVVMATPSEITLRTSTGLQRFKLTPQTEQLAGYREGELVTVYFTPDKGTLRITTAAAASTPQTDTSQAEVAGGGASSDSAQASSSNPTQATSDDSTQASTDDSAQKSPDNSMQASTDDTNQASSQSPAQPAQPAGTQATAPSNEPAATTAPAATASSQNKQLPKTASELPLLGLVGLLGLGGAVALRLALKA